MQRLREMPCNVPFESVRARLPGAHLSGNDDDAAHGLVIFSQHQQTPLRMMIF